MAAGFNLVREPWLPVRRAGGAREWIAPWQIAEGDDPPLALDWPRPDFNGAGLEFLIGLVSTVLAPRDLDAWSDAWHEAPRPEDLRLACEAVSFAFDLDGEGPRFLQELGSLTDPTRRDVAALLIDQPGEQGIRRNTDHFTKAGGVRRLSRAAAAMALYTVQTYSPAGGAGFMTSMRGGGPLTTLVLPESSGRMPTLWRQVWANVPEASWSDWRANPAKVFPWLALTRSAKTHPATTPADGHDLQAFWGMPRRVRLILDVCDGPCDLGGPDDSVQVVGWETKRHGVKYVGWVHPLTPYTDGVDAQPPNPRKGQPGGVSYRHWLGLVQEDTDKGRKPAACVRDFRARRAQTCEGLSQIRLRAFGYDMDNMKARCWCDAEMPVRLLPADRREAVEARIAQLVRGADAAAGLTRSAVKRARFARPAEAPGDFSFITEQFWQRTEAAFLAQVEALGRAADPGDAILREDWLRQLRRAALALFDALAPGEGIEAGDWRRLVEARRALAGALDGKDVRTPLGLGLTERAAKRGRKVA